MIRKLAGRKILIGSVCLLLAACDYADFGQRAYDWVSQKARHYSEQLSRQDLSVRWRQIENVGYGEISHSLTIIDELLQKLHEETRALDDRFKQNPDQLDALVKTYEQAFKARALLFDLLFYFEAIQKRLAFLDSPCGRDDFDRLGLYSVADYSVLESFISISDRAQRANDDRYGIYVGYTFDLDENGNPEEKPSGGKEQLQHFLKSFTLIYDSIFAAFNQDKIDEQKQKLEEAIDLFNSLTLKPAEVYEISRAECEAMVERTDIERLKAHLTYSNYRQLFDQQQQLQLERQTRSYLELLPVKIQAINDREGFAQAYAHLLDQQKAFTVLQALDKEINYVLNKRLKMAVACPDVAGWSLYEDYHDGLLQLQNSLSLAETDIDILQESVALLAVRQRVTGLLGTANKDRRQLQARDCPK